MILSQKKNHNMHDATKRQVLVKRKNKKANPSDLKKNILSGASCIFLIKEY